MCFALVLCLCAVALVVVWLLDLCWCVCLRLMRICVCCIRQANTHERKQNEQTTSSGSFQQRSTLFLLLRVAFRFRKRFWAWRGCCLSLCRAGSCSLDCACKHMHTQKSTTARRTETKWNAPSRTSMWTSESSPVAGRAFASRAEEVPFLIFWSNWQTQSLQFSLDSLLVTATQSSWPTANNQKWWTSTFTRKNTGTRRWQSKKVKANAMT